jgi:hypothetical protein
MRLTRTADFNRLGSRQTGSDRRFPSGRTDASAFSAAPCVFSAPDALRAFPKRMSPSASPTPPTRRERFFPSNRFSSTQRNTHAQ